MSSRRFPPPWSVEEMNDACFIVKDGAGQKLAYVYFEEQPGRRRGTGSCIGRRLCKRPITRARVCFKPIQSLGRELRLLVLHLDQAGE
jgi:hypothetical protein